MLWWIDIVGRCIHSYDPASLVDEQYPTPCQVGCLGLRQQGGLIAGMEHGVALFEPGANSWKVLAAIDPDIPDNRINDGKVDPQGRFVVGTLSTTHASGAAALWRVGGDGAPHQLRDSLTISNGLDWSPDSDTFYHVDSVEKVVRAYDWRADTTSLPEGRVVIDASDDRDTRLLDGMCVDAEGMLWVAHFGAGKISRWNPRTGRELARAALPAPRVTCCAFGGPRLDTLFVTTARIGLDDRQLAAWPLSGSLFAIEAGVPGLPARIFKEE